MSRAAQRPRFSEREASEIGSQQFGLSGTVRPLASERDQNFKLSTAGGESFVLKIANAGESEGFLDLQNRVLEWLSRGELQVPVPRLRRTLEGPDLGRVEGANGSQHLVRVLSFLPGDVLAGARPRSAQLLGELGRFLGRLDVALEDFSHPVASERELPWDLARARGVIESERPLLQEPRQRKLVAGVLERLVEDAEPLFPGLPRSVIHNDANDHNVLVGPPGPEGREIVGLIDFGDMVETATVCELAIAIAYAMLDTPDPLAAACAVVSGYHETRELSGPELQALFPLACARLGVSVCLSARARADEPGNDYLTVSEAPAWTALERLSGIPPRLAHFRFRDACGMVPCPTSPVVVEYLRGQDCARVVEPDLTSCAKRVFDLSVGSPELPSLSSATDMDTLTGLLSAGMRESGAEVGIGRYDEARLFYVSDAFRGESGEWRSIHLGIDLFLEAGAPVFAPLDGVVHAARDNATRLDYGPTLVLRHEPADAPVFFTLYGHLSADSLTRVAPGQAIARGQQIARIGPRPINGDWPPHLHFQVIVDALDRAADFPGVAAPSERAVWLSLCPDPNLLLGIPGSETTAREPSPGQVLEERGKHLSPSLSVAYRSPLKIVRGEGAYLYDEVGRPFLDGVNNVCHVGHCHPKVVAAAQRQMAVLNTNTRYLHDGIVEYARRLSALFPDPLDVCFLVCSGSEANELALRLARTHTGRRDLLVVEGAYHGNSGNLIDASPYKFDGPGGVGAPRHIRQVAMPDGYRGRHRYGEPDLGERYAQDVGEALEECDAAAFICESLLGCGGQIVLPEGYLAAAFGPAREAGAVCIADEVQVGFGRVGSHFWGFETQDVVPDIVTLGKPIGNGHPLAAVVTTREIASSFDNGMEYFNTFGGNPVSCAVGLAVLDVIEEEGLQAHARDVGERLLEALRGLMERHAVIGDVRGLGLFVGIELVLDRQTREPAPAQASYVIQRCRERGILLSTDGPLHNVLKLKPPLVFSQADAERLVATLDGVLDEDFVARADL